MRTPITIEKRVYGPPPTVGRDYRDDRSKSAEEAKKQLDKIRNTGHSRARSGARVLLPARDGCVFVVSDQHYCPGLEPSPVHKSSIILAKRLKPYAIVSNGDAIDGASISRWPVSSFTELGDRPGVSVELAETANRLREYEALKFVQFLVWNLGNHDARFETRLAEKVPEYSGVNGTTLKDHFPGWLPAWATWMMPAGGSTQPEVVIKHRFKSGVYGASNSALWSGTSMVTGHDHKLWVKPISDYRGLRWGIDAGTVSDVYSPHFLNYTEDNPQDWQSGFVILHFRGGKFTGPELVWGMPDGKVLFRGEVIKA